MTVGSLFSILQELLFIHVFKAGSAVSSAFLVHDMWLAGPVAMATALAIIKVHVEQ